MALELIKKPPTAKSIRRKVELGVDSNLLDIYMYAIGKSEIPEIWHKWCLISLVAASVGKRVAFPKFEHAPIWPNLYIFLVGPSGLGKGAALAHMLQLEDKRHNVLNGAATHKALISRFSTSSPQDHPGYETCFLLHEELGNSVPQGPMGKAFVKFMTDGYLRAGEEYTDATRKDGEVSFSKPCINWLAGSTPEWLGESISVEDMLSGFFGRVIGVPAWYDFDNRIYMPSRHDVPNREELINYLCVRVHYLTTLPENSLFTMTRAAQDIDETWYMQRPVPADPRMIPFWRRESDLVLKLAMIMSLCDDMSLEIDVPHIVKAHELVREAREAIPLIINWSTETTLTAQERVVEHFLRVRSGRWVKRSRLYDEVRRRSITGKAMLEIIESLEMRGLVVSRKSGNSMEYRYEPPNQKRLFA